MVFKDSSSPDHSVILYLPSATLAVSGLQDRVLVAGAAEVAFANRAQQRPASEQSWHRVLPELSCGSTD